MQMLLHKPHPCTPLPSLVVHPPPPPKNSSPNLRATTFLQSLVSSTPNRHNHFPSKSLLKMVNFLTPNPPFSRGAHTLSHPTRCVLESPHRKSLCNLSILLATCVAIVKRDKKKVGRLDNILLSNVTVLPFDKYILPTNQLTLNFLQYRIPNSRGLVG